ncbi:hypothetical protein [Salipiger mucosus]|nr:hypothetical protein [Salipiger mucosus]
MLTTGLAQADPAPKVDYVFAVKDGVMQRCIGDVDIVFGLANAALDDQRGLGRRDVHRIVNTCALRYRLARRNGLSYVALEAFQDDSCLDDSCRMRYREPLAKQIYALSATYTAAYAEVLHGNLVDACSQTHELDCVPHAVDITAEQPIAAGFGWLQLDQDGRLDRLAKVDPARYGTIPDISGTGAAGPPEGSSVAEDTAAIDGAETTDAILAIRDAATETFGDDIPSGDLVAGMQEALSEVDLAVQQERVLISDTIDPVSVDGVNGLIRITVPAPRGVCLALLSDAASFDATEITVDRDLWVTGSDPEAVCSHSNTNVRIVY